MDQQQLVAFHGEKSSMTPYASGSLTNQLVTTVDVMYAPILGPDHPMRNPNQASCGISKIQYTSVADWSFDEQYNSFQSSGRAIDISNNSMISSLHPEPKRAKSSGKLSKHLFIYLMREVGDDWPYFMILMY